MRRPRLVAACIGLALLAAVPPGCGDGVIVSDVYYVDPTGSGADGVTWATAFKTVQRAVDVAGSVGGAEVWVAAGTYTNGGGTDPVLELKENVHVYGGFEGYNDGAGAQETDRSQRDPWVNRSILDGEFAALHVVFAPKSGTIDGFLITGGAALGSEWPEYVGGGLIATVVPDGPGSTASVLVANCEFRENSAKYGGGIANQLASMTCVNNVFSDNVALWDGGGADLCGSSVVANCVFLGNVAVENGGAVSLASWSGGNFIQNCALAGNRALSRGGGIWKSPYAEGGVSMCTIVGNRADGEGGAIGIDDRQGSIFALWNSVVWANAPEAVWIWTGEELAIGVRFSDIEGCGGSGAGWNNAFGFDDGGNIDADPLFVDADGADDTYGTADDDLRLQGGSPCIDAGSNVWVESDRGDIDGDGDTTEPLPYDLDGYPRFVDDPATADTGEGSPPIIDMGAYEFQP